MPWLLFVYELKRRLKLKGMLGNAIFCYVVMFALLNLFYMGEEGVAYRVLLTSCFAMFLFPLFDVLHDYRNDGLYEQLLLNEAPLWNSLLALLCAYTAVLLLPTFILTLLGGMILGAHVGIAIGVLGCMFISAPLLVAFSMAPMSIRCLHEKKDRYHFDLIMVACYALPWIVSLQAEFEHEPMVRLLMMTILLTPLLIWLSSKIMRWKRFE